MWPLGHPPDAVDITEPGISRPSVFRPPTNDKTNHLEFPAQPKTDQIHDPYKGEIGRITMPLSLWVRSSSCHNTQAKASHLLKGLTSHRALSLGHQLKEEVS